MSTFRRAGDRRPEALAMLAGAAVAAACTDAPLEATSFHVERDTIAGVAVVRSVGEPPVWELRPLWRVGGAAPGDTAELFGRINALAADSRGRLYAADRMLNTVRVFDDRGRYLGTVGREGQGPGEFLDPSGLAFLGDTLAVVDPGNVRIGLFGPDGEWAGQRSGAPVTGPGNHAMPTGPAEFWTFGVRTGSEGIGVVWVRHDRTGPTDSIMTRPARPPDLREPENRVECHTGESIHFHSVSFAPRSVRAPAPDGLAVESEPAGYGVVFLSAGGDTIRRVEWATERVRPTDEEWAREVEAFEAWKDELPPGGCPGMSIERPERKRMVSEVWFDDRQRMWVRRVEQEADSASVLDVFATDGSLLGTLTTPRARQLPPYVWGDRLYLVTLDEMDVPTVRAFELVPPEGP